jgi:hypothetical protein
MSKSKTENSENMPETISDVRFDTRNELYKYNNGFEGKTKSPFMMTEEFH